MTDRACVIQGDCPDVLKTLEPGSLDAIVTDPPYGMAWDTDTTRFSGGTVPTGRSKGQARGIKQGRDDRGPIAGDDTPFDPAPWLDFPRVILWGANHFAQSLPCGTSLVWLKKPDHLFGTFLSDAELGWQKGGHGVYCFRYNRAADFAGGRGFHASQKPVELMRWCIRRLNLAPDSLVLDPYAGSGSTGVAAVLEGFRFLGVELDARYCDIARRRIADAEAQLTLGLEGTGREFVARLSERG